MISRQEYIPIGVCQENNKETGVVLLIVTAKRQFFEHVYQACYTQMLLFVASAMGAYLLAVLETAVLQSSTTDAPLSTTLVGMHRTYFPKKS